MKFRKTLGNHTATQRVNDLSAHDDILMQSLAAQIEITMLEANLFGIVLLTKDRQWQWRSGALNDGFIGAKLNLTRWDFRIHGLSVAFKQFARDGDNRLAGAAF